ncbi:hypothetical protein CE141_27745 (plasmid) [Escherichia coli]|nr:hypothetical protein CE141_27745 [Escherichia coli]MDN1693714.1 hypothetical protein [Escherichia coli]
MLAMIIFPYVNLKFIVVSVFAFDELNYRYAKIDCKCFLKFFAGMKVLEIKARSSKVFPK